MIDSCGCLQIVLNNLPAGLFVIIGCELKCVDYSIWLVSCVGGVRLFDLVLWLFGGCFGLFGFVGVGFVVVGDLGWLLSFVLFC